MTLTAWVIAVLSIPLPQSYSLIGDSSDTIAHPHFPGVHARQEYRVWQSSDGKRVTLFYWVPRPSRDSGPAVFIREHPVVVAGQRTSIGETSQFMGQAQHALVTYLSFADPEARAVIYATGLTMDEFTEILDHVQVLPVRQPE